MIIKKLNSLFHRHSKWLFGIFTLVIIVSFLGFLTPGQFGCDYFANPNSQQVGVAFGKKVSMDDIRRQTERQMAFMHVVWGLSTQDIKLDQAFQLLCYVRAAQNANLAVSDREVADFIKTVPSFQTDGKFDHKKYELVMSNLARFGLKVGEFNEAVRDQLLAQKLSNQAMINVIATPLEAEALYKLINSKNKVRIAEFKAADFVKKVEIKGDDLKAYFDKNKTAYSITGNVTAKVIEFPFAQYKAAAEKTATDVELEKFYNKRKELFVKNDKPQEFAKIKADVKVKYIADKTAELARRAAYEFAAAASQLINDDQNKLQAFADLAAKSKFKVVEAVKVDFDDEVIGNIKSKDLVKALSSAVETSPLTKPVIGADGVYIGFMTEKIATRPAEFNEVAKKVTGDFVKAMSLVAAQEAATAASAELNAIADEAARAKAFNELKNCSFKDVEFSMVDQKNMAGYDLAAMVASGLNVGAVSQALNNPNGAYLVEMVKVTAPDMKDFEGKKAEYMEIARSLKARQTMQALEDKINAQCFLTAKE